MPANTQRLEILSGWKEIANYLGKGVRTVQRYERDLHLPIRRPAGKQQGTGGAVIATKGELDGWLMATPIHQTFQLQTSEFDKAAVKELRSNLAMSRLLREEHAQARAAVRMCLEQLRKTLCFAIPETGEATLPRRIGIATSTERKIVADVLHFKAANTNVN